MFIRNHHSQAKSHSSYEIMHLTPSLINTISVRLRTAAKAMSIFSTRHALVWCRGRKSHSIAHIPSLSLYKRKKEPCAFDTAITAVKCGLHRFDGWMTKNCFAIVLVKDENHHEKRVHSVLSSEGLMSLAQQPSDINWKHYVYIYIFLYIYVHSIFLSNSALL